MPALRRLRQEDQKSRNMHSFIENLKQPEIQVAPILKKIRLSVLGFYTRVFCLLNSNYKTL